MNKKVQIMAAVAVIALAGCVASQPPTQRQARGPSAQQQAPAPQAQARRASPEAEPAMNKKAKAATKPYTMAELANSYRDYSESDYANAWDLKKDGTVHFEYSEAGDGKGHSLSLKGRWTVTNNRISIELKRGKKTERFLFQVMEELPDWVGCLGKGAFGLKVLQGDSQNLWRTREVDRNRAPCKPA